MTERSLLYIAAPLGLPSRIGWKAVLRNVRTVEKLAVELVKVGWSPIVPHGNARWPGAFELPHALWLEVDEALVRVSAALVRIPGDSVGADHEVALARLLSIPVLTVEEALCGPQGCCTGVSAQWCPIHGDCSCPDGGDLNDQNCALHSPGSTHAEAGFLHSGRA